MPEGAFCELEVKVTPRSSRNKVEVTPEGVRIWTTAAPANSQANNAVRKILAKALRTPKSSVSIAKGLASRMKRVRIEGLSLEATLERLRSSS